MKLKFLFLLVMISELPGMAQVNYNALSIPDSMKNNANVAVRLNEENFEVTDADRAMYHIHKIITILNRNGDASLVFREFTNKYISLEDCEIRVFDSAGNQSLKYKKKDLFKQAYGDGLVPDGTINYLIVSVSSYPITIDYDYKIKYTGTLSYPHYQIQDDNESVEKSSFTVKAPKELGIRFKAYRTILAPKTEDDGKSLTYQWAVNNLTASKPEPEASEGISSSPSIILAPNKFGIYNTIGDMSTWKNFGTWEYNLLKGLDELPEERKAFFRDLVKNAKSDREKIALIYNYLQQNFRYVSIQLGIGGWQPFPAKFTDEKKYGDCKGLSFYTCSVLKALGIKSYIALINAKYNQVPVDPAFPCNAFTHVILCVPQQKDTIWLECTNRTIDFNYLGSFTENRYALLVTEEGGVLVPTPISQASKNKISFVTKINLNEDGSGQSSTLLLFKGDPKLSLNDYISSKSDEQKELIVNGLGFKQPDNFTLKRLDEEDVQINLDIEKIPQFTSGSKMFLSPRINRFWSTVLPSTPNRKFDYFFHYAVDKTDSTIYQLPEGFTVDALPKPIDAKCAYATYTTNYIYNKDKNQIISTARLILSRNRIPAAQYAEVKSFFDGVISDEGQKLVIKKN